VSAFGFPDTATACEGQRSALTMMSVLADTLEGAREHVKKCVYAAAELRVVARSWRLCTVRLKCRDTLSERGGSKASLGRDLRVKVSVRTRPATAQKAPQNASQDA